jgi:hypothetical protein
MLACCVHTFTTVLRLGRIQRCCGKMNTYAAVVIIWAVFNERLRRQVRCGGMYWLHGTQWRIQHIVLVVCLLS